MATGVLQYDPTPCAITRVRVLVLVWLGLSLCVCKCAQVQLCHRVCVVRGAQSEDLTGTDEFSQRAQCSSAAVAAHISAPVGAVLTAKPTTRGFVSPLPHCHLRHLHAWRGDPNASDDTLYLSWLQCRPIGRTEPVFDDGIHLVSCQHRELDPPAPGCPDWINRFTPREATHTQHSQ